MHSLFKSRFHSCCRRTLMLKLPSDIFSVWWVLVFCVLFLRGLMARLHLYPRHGNVIQSRGWLPKVE